MGWSLCGAASFPRAPHAFRSDIGPAKWMGAIGCAASLTGKFLLRGSCLGRANPFLLQHSWKRRALDFMGCTSDGSNTKLLNSSHEPSMLITTVRGFVDCPSASLPPDAPAKTGASPCK